MNLFKTYKEKKKAKKAVKELKFSVDYHKNQGINILDEEEKLSQAEEIFKKDYQEAKKIALEAKTGLEDKIASSYSFLLRAIKQRNSIENNINEIHQSIEKVEKECSENPEIKETYGGKIKMLKEQSEKDKIGYELILSKLEMMVFQFTATTTFFKSKEEKGFLTGLSCILTDAIDISKQEPPKSIYV